MNTPMDKGLDQKHSKKQKVVTLAKVEVLNHCFSESSSPEAALYMYLTQKKLILEQNTKCKPNAQPHGLGIQRNMLQKQQ